MNVRRASLRLAAAAAVLALLSSCVGVSADIDIQEDGSGTVSIDYRVSRLVEAMGKTGGDERWLPLPLTRSELERFLTEIGGLTLSSFASESDETDLSFDAVVRFADLRALSRFLVLSGRQASIAERDGRRELRLRVSEGGGPLDPDLKRLVDAVFRGYAVSLRVRTPAVPAVSGEGSVDQAARAARFEAPVPVLLSSEKAVEWIASW